MKRLFLGIITASLLISLCAGCSDDSDSLNYKVVKSDESQSQAENSVVSGSDDWSDLDVKIDGESYSPIFDYKKLTDKGWYFDPALYGLEDCQLEKGLLLSCDVYLNNPAFEDGVIAVGFVNVEDEKKSLDDSKVYAIRANVKDKLNRPNITVPGNIAFGATADDIIAALGEPNEVIRNDEQAKNEYVYKKDNKEVHYYVYDTGNMLEFMAQCF